MKRLLSVVLVSLLLTGCSTNTLSLQSDSTQLRSDVTAEDYLDFQEKLTNSLDGAIYGKEPVLVSISNDSNFDENDSVSKTLYFKNGEEKLRIQFPLSSSGTDVDSIKNYYSTCETIADLIIVEPFQAGTINSYTPDKFYLTNNELWQIIIDDEVGAIFQYFKMDYEGRILEQVNVLRAVAQTTDENIDEAEADYTSWSFEKLKDFMDNASEKTKSIYTYNDYNMLNTKVSEEEWLEIALKAAKTAPEPIFTTSEGEFITNVNQSSDGLTCRLKG